MGNAAAKQHGRKYVHWDTAVTPAPPGKPHLVPGTPHTQPDVVTIRWEAPVNDGGASVIGYLVEHRRTGSPHWVRATPALVPLLELTLSGLEPGWRYQFRVSAQNAVGLSEPGDVSEPLVVTLNRSTTAAPHFLQELQDVVVLENDTAEFRVVFRGTPAPKISWYKNGFEIFSSRRMRVVAEGDHSSLIIYQTVFSDEGDIKCTATNRVGHVVTKAKLRLEAPPRFRLPRHYEEGLLFEMGEVIRLKVSVAGRPLPRVTWLHNGELVPFGGRYEVTNTERASVLRVAEARRSDRGEYQVRATSRLGEDAAAFLVTVTDRPMPPGKAKVITAQGRTVSLTWSEPDDDGGCKIGNYIVEYYRIGWNVWLKATTCRQLSTVLEELIEGSEYKFRVKAENPYGVSDPSDESVVVFIPDPRRGLLEPPARKKGSDSVASKKYATLPVLDTNKKIDGRSISPPSKKDAPDPRLRKSEMWETVDPHSPVVSFDHVQVSTDVDENTKENVYQKKHKVQPTDHLPPPVPPKTLRRGGKPLSDSDPQPPLRQKAVPAPTTQTQRQEQEERTVRKTESVTCRRSPDAPRPTRKTDDHLLNAGSPLMPREEDDSILHGSSELMLVLLPHSSVEGDGGREEEEEDVKSPARSVPDFGQESLQESVAPPLSLSAPELGFGEALLGPPMRNSVSSTELLHERAMARFYQAVAAEETQKALQRRRSIEGALLPPPPAALTGSRSRGASLTDEEDVRRALRPRPTVPPPQLLPAAPPTQPFAEAQGERRLATAHCVRSQVPPQQQPLPPPPATRSVEEKKLDITQLRERLQEAPSGRMPGHAYTPAPSRMDSEESRESDVEAYHTGHSADASADASLDYEDDDEDDDDEEEPYELRAPMPRPFRPRYSKDEDFDEEEEETYHPRSVVPAPPALSRTPQEFPPLPPHSRLIRRSPPVVTPKPILKKPLSSSPEPLLSPATSPRSLSPASPQRSLSPTPFQRPFFPSVDDPEVVLRCRRSPAPAPEVPVLTGVPPLQATPQAGDGGPSAAAFACQRRLQPRQNSLEKGEEVLTCAISDHYGDIISEYNRTRKPQKKLYTNTTELKAAAEHQSRPLLLPNSPPAELKEASKKLKPKEPERPTEPLPEEAPSLMSRFSWVWSWGWSKAEDETELEDKKKLQGNKPDRKQAQKKESEKEWEDEFEEVSEKEEGEEEEEPPKQTPSPSAETPFGPSPITNAHEPTNAGTPTEATPAPALAPASTPTPERLLPVRSLTPQEDEALRKVAEKKVRTTIEYLTDVAMFSVACWLYVFEDELYAVPVLLLMVYRQLWDAVRSRIPKFFRRSQQT